MFDCVYLPAFVSSARIQKLFGSHLIVNVYGAVKELCVFDDILPSYNIKNLLYNIARIILEMRADFYIAKDFYENRNYYSRCLRKSAINGGREAYAFFHRCWDAMLLYVLWAGRISWCTYILMKSVYTFSGTHRTIKICINFMFFVVMLCLYLCELAW